MTYAQYESTRFLVNVEEANTRLNELEAQKGLKPSSFDGNVEAVNRRIWELENSSHPAPGAAATTTTTTKPAPSADLVGLKARRDELLRCLGLNPAYQAECKTVEAYKAAIAKLEARVGETGKAEREEPKAEAPQPTLDAAFFKTGKATGLAKAVGAAASRTN